MMHTAFPAMPSSSSSSDTTPSCGGTLVCVDGRTLPLRCARLLGRHRAGLGRITLEQTFENPYAEPLRVTYQLPLPEEGAVSGFSFRIGDREIVGEVDRKDRARERFEQAIAQGRSAAHLEQERGSLFTQEVGNIPPGTAVAVKIEIDQRLVWIPDAGLGAGGWEWRFPTVVAPRYLGAAGRTPDAARVAVTTTEQARPITMSMEVELADVMPHGSAASSPSHALVSDRGRVRFADEGVGLDRDVVVRWPVATPKVGLEIDVARPKPGHAMQEHLFGLLTVVPPSVRSAAPVARDLVVLLDTSGSMSGEPLEQAQRVTSALIDGLTERDTLELIEFSSSARRFAEAPMAATAQARARALKWVGSLRASGGTEMVSGILAALQGVRPEAQRQVVVITDGLIGFERDVVAAILEQLPPGSRLHTVGVGSAVNRSLTGPAARAGRGLEVVIGLGEDPERATRRILDRTADPIVVDLELEGEALLEQAPLRLPDLYAGCPALISVKLAPGGGTLRLRGRTAAGLWEARIEAQTPAEGQGSPGVITCFAREQVEDHELMWTAGADRKQADAAITGLGLNFQISTRLTSWVAISEQIDVDPGDPTRRESVPQEIPYGMSVEGLGLRATSLGAPAGPPPAPMAAPARSSGRGTTIRRRGAAPERQKKQADNGKLSSTFGGVGSRSDDFDADALAAEGFANDDFAEMAEAEEPSAEVVKERREQAGALRRPGYQGLVVSKSEDTWIIEVIITETTRWQPRGIVSIRLSDGTGIQASVVPEGTTRSGDLAAGVRVRLVLQLATSTTLEPWELSFDNDGHLFTVVF